VFLFGEDNATAEETVSTMELLKGDAIVSSLFQDLLQSPPRSDTGVYD